MSMIKLSLVDLATKQIFSEYAFDSTDPTGVFRISKAIRKRYKCDEDEVVCVNNTEDGSDVLVCDKLVARINAAFIP